MSRTKWGKQSAEFIAVKEKDASGYLSLLNNGEEHQAILKKPGASESNGVSATVNKFVEDSKGRLFITVNFDETKIDTTLNEWLISLYLPTESLFFKAKIDIKNDKEKNYIFEIKGGVFKIQRRENYRLPISDPDKMPVTFRVKDLEDTITLSMANISSNGVAVYAMDSALAKSLVMGTTVVDISFSIEEKNFSKIVGEVRHPADLNSVRPKKGYKVGIHLLNLSPAQQRYIAAYILRELSRFFGRT